MKWTGILCEVWYFVTGNNIFLIKNILILNHGFLFIPKHSRGDGYSADYGNSSFIQGV